MVHDGFPDPRLASPEGIVAFGGDLKVERLITAYQMGIFPWPIEGLPLPWFCPPLRGVLEYDHLHISRSLARARKKSHFEFTVDRAFLEVISACSLSPRPGQNGTWITPEMINAFCELHRLGIAHSIEVWKEGQLVGGIYGVDSGGVFGGESMFHRESNASKLAILYLMEYLHAQGLNWLDIQVLTPHLEALGAREIPREEFLERLQNTQKKRLKLF